MALYVVTGGAGFIGSHLVEALVKRGEQVRVFDDFSSGKLENFANCADQIEVVEGDLCQMEDVRRVVDGADYVLHQGALRSVPRSVDNPVASNDVNVGGTLNVLHASKEAGVKRVVAASSSSVYGSRDDFPLAEDAGDLEPMSPYAVSKLAGEKYCKVFTRLYGLETVSLRYFNVFGPRMDSNSSYAAFIAIFIDGLLNANPLKVNGDGSVSRDWTYIDNVVDANLRAVTAPEAAGEAFNVACGDSWDLNRVIEELRKLTGAVGNIEYGPHRAGDMPMSRASIEKARRLLGYVPQVGAPEGLRRTVEWYRQADPGMSASDVTPA
jgi:nucleoside-diphosphate-sugar epimerase